VLKIKRIAVGAPSANCEKKCDGAKKRRTERLCWGRVARETMTFTIPKAPPVGGGRRSMSSTSQPPGRTTSTSSLRIAFFRTRWRRRSRPSWRRRSKTATAVARTRSCEKKQSEHLSTIQPVVVLALPRPTRRRSSPFLLPRRVRHRPLGREFGRGPASGCFQSRILGSAQADDWRTVLRGLALVVASVIARQDDAEHAHRFFQHNLRLALDGRAVGGP